MALNPVEMKTLREVVSLPTAPFHESRVQAYVEAWSKSVGIGLRRDEAGNLLLSLSGKKRPKGRPWVLQAHMDHPGFSMIRQRGRSVQAWFRGGVRKDYFIGSRMRFFAATGISVAGTVQLVRRDAESGFLRCRIELDDVMDLPVGTLGMWEIPAWRSRSEVLSLRVADDLCGVAAILLTMARLKCSGCQRTVHGLLTRAEEVGFVGALSAVRNKLIDPSWPVLGIEASKKQPGVRLGDGAVIRVGDALTVFDPALTAVLRQVARDLGKSGKTAHLNYVAALMPGGSTESTGLAQMGYRTCAVCLPLGNYHNMGRHAIAPERIHLRDFEALVALLAEVARRNPDAAADHGLKARLLENHRKRSSLL